MNAGGRDGNRTERRGKAKLHSGSVHHSVLLSGKTDYAKLSHALLKGKLVTVMLRVIAYCHKPSA